MSSSMVPPTLAVSVRLGIVQVEEISYSYEETQISETMIVLLILAGFLMWLYWYTTSSFGYWKAKGVSGFTPMPLLGNTWRNALGKESFTESIKRWYSQSIGKKAIGLYHFSRPVMLVRDPDIIKQILVKDFQYFPDRGILYDKRRQPLSAHLFVLSGPIWKSLRIKLTPTFTTGKMKKMFSVINDCSKHLVSYLQSKASENGIIECKDITGKYTTDVIATCAFGLQLDAISDTESEFRKMGNKLFRPASSDLLLSVMYTLCPSLLNLFHRPKSVVDEVHQFFLKEVNDIVAYRESNNIQRNDFLNLLIELKKNGKVEIEREDRNEVDEDMQTVHDHVKDEGNSNDHFELTETLLASQCFVFFIAGYDTASSVMSFCLYELALNPDIQLIVYQEIHRALQENQGEITYEAVQGMKYLDMVVAETLRKYPTLPSLSRRCTKNYTLPGTNITLEAGTRVFIPVAGLHHDPEYFPNPEKFDPERFSEENKKKRDKHVYLPFGDGPRICIGMRFGQMSAKVGLIALISNFEFSVCEKTEIPIPLNSRSMIISPKDGIYIKISHRIKQSQK